MAFTLQIHTHEAVNLPMAPEKKSLIARMAPSLLVGEETSFCMCNAQRTYKKPWSLSSSILSLNINQQSIISQITNQIIAKITITATLQDVHPEDRSHPPGRHSEPSLHYGRYLFRRSPRERHIRWLFLISCRLPWRWDQAYFR